MTKTSSDARPAKTGATSPGCGCGCGCGGGKPTQTVFPKASLTARKPNKVVTK